MKSRSLACLLSLLALAIASSAEPLSTSIVDSYAIWPGQAPQMRDPPANERIEGQAGNRAVSAISRPTITAFFAANPNGAAALILPGGSFRHVVFDKEGTDIARWLNSLGVDAFVLKYRLLREAHNTNPANGLADVQRAIRIIRAGHLSANIGHPLDPKRVGVFGFSAGGNLAGLSANYHATKLYEPLDAADALSARPDFLVLGYAWLPLKGEVPEAQTFFRTYGFVESISADTPQIFVFAGDADTKVPVVHSQRLEPALKQVGVPVELHVFAGAPHGFALRGTGEEKAWPELCAAWFRARGIIPAN